MKTCAICNLHNADVEETCVACGEASWLAVDAPAVMALAKSLIVETTTPADLDKFVADNPPTPADPDAIETAPLGPKGRKGWRR